MKDKIPDVPDKTSSALIPTTTTVLLYAKYKDLTTGSNFRKQKITYNTR